MLSADAGLVTPSDFFDQGLPTFGTMNSILSREEKYVVAELGQKVILISDRLAVAYAGHYASAIEALKMLADQERMAPLSANDLERFLEAFSKQYTERKKISLLATLMVGPSQGFNIGLNCDLFESKTGDAIRVSGTGGEDISNVIASVTERNEASWRDGYAAAVSIAGAMYQYEMITGRGLKERFGGAYELAMLDAGRFQKLTAVTWLFWAADFYPSRTNRLMLKRALTQHYREGHLVIRTLDDRSSDPEIKIYPVWNPLHDDKPQIKHEDAPFATAWQVNVFVARNSNGTISSKLWIKHGEETEPHPARFSEVSGTLTFRADLARLREWYDAEA